MDIMIVEDDKHLAKMMETHLVDKGLSVFVTKVFTEIDQQFINIKPRLLILDINLPTYSGFYWCEQIRHMSDVPILFISSRNEDTDKIRGFGSGADDYIEKPFSIDILYAKIIVMFRRTYKHDFEEKTKLVEEVYYNWNLKKIESAQVSYELTKSECTIFETLLNNRGKVVSRDKLMTQLWDTNEFISDTTLSVLISRFRSKITTICSSEIIETRKGLGYIIQ